MSMTLRQRYYQILESQDEKKTSARYLNFFLWILIATNVIAIILESEADISAQYGTYFHIFEAFSIICFTVEYLARVWVSIEANDSDHSPLMSRLRYMLTPMAMVDLLSILPFYLSALWGIDDLRILRALRLLRVLKLTRYSRSIELLRAVFRQEMENLVSALFILAVLIIMAATGIYLVEGHIQEDIFGSIPRSLWWATITLTTVGYGDTYPITAAGKLFSALITICGVAIAALPAGILASGLMNELDRRRDRFRAYVREAYDDHRVDLEEIRQLMTYRNELGISAADARLIMEEVRQEASILSHHQCPYCQNHLAVRHPAGAVKVFTHQDPAAIQTDTATQDIELDNETLHPK